MCNLIVDVIFTTDVNNIVLDSNKTLTFFNSFPGRLPQQGQLVFHFLACQVSMRSTQHSTVLPAGSVLGTSTAIIAVSLTCLAKISAGNKTSSNLWFIVAPPANFNAALQKDFVFTLNKPQDAYRAFAPFITNPADASIGVQCTDANGLNCWFLNDHHLLIYARITPVFPLTRSLTASCGPETNHSNNSCLRLCYQNTAGPTRICKQLLRHASRKNRAVRSVCNRRICHCQ